MKKTVLTVIIILQAVYGMAQGRFVFPFEGGKDAMSQFFKDSLVVSPDIIQKKVIGTAVFKFTANEKGAISKIIVYYADDAVLAFPVIDALKKSDRKWVIPSGEKTHDFIVSFIFSFNAPAGDDGYLQKIVYDSYHNRNPIIASDQVPLDMATLLPPVTINYAVTP
jgi:hypothetical protein